VAARETIAADPARWQGDVALIDGGTVHIRPVRSDDVALLEAFHARQSRESIYFRYFSPMPTLSRRELDRLTNADHLDHLTFVALLAGDAIGLAGYDRIGRTDAAEVSFITDDQHHGRGLATVLLEWLVVAAREAGFGKLVANVLPTNRSMLGVFHQTGFETTSTFDEGVVEVSLGLEPTEEAAAAIDERGRRSEGRSVERLVCPTSVAVVGAGRERGGLGHEVLRSLLAHDFRGPVYPVNPQGGHVASVPSYASVLDIPHDVDLAVVAVPADEVRGVVEQCARKRVQGLVVMSAGLHGTSSIAGPPPTVPSAEPDQARALVELARSHGMRLIGPESLGVINTDPTVDLHASIAPIDVLPGRVGFVTQSGTLGIAALEHASRVGLGFSTFIDIGARADVSGNDVLQYWEEDDRTDVVLLYLESFGNPRKFTRIARRLARHKPIIAVKSGGDRSGREATTVAALLDQSGVLRVDTPTQLFDLARVLVDQPVPAGRRVAVVSNSRGASNLTVDALRGAGLEAATPSDATCTALAADVDAAVVGGEVVDLGFAAGPDEYEAALRLVLADEAVDAVIVVYAPPGTADREAVGRAIVRATAPSTRRVPVLATFLGAAIAAPLAGFGVRIPLFEFPDGAAQVLGAMARRGAFLAEPVGTPPDLDPSTLDGARELVAAHLDAGAEPGWLGIDAAAQLLDTLSISLIPYRLVGSGDEAVAAAEEIGHPVVLKATGLPRLRPTEAGGVALDVHGPDEVRAAYGRMRALLGEAMCPAMVQRMAPGGLDVVVAGHQDAAQGPVIALGFGGSVADANPRRAVRVTPITDADARRAIRSSPVGRFVVTSEEGGPPTPLESLVMRIGWIVEQIPEIADLELNPVLAGDEAVSITAARIRLAAVPAVPEPDVRRLR
jgi:acyl-CoA synthetase (NDP forming)/RimJ/RimL family protein N-acetyltransferase